MHLRSRRSHLQPCGIILTDTPLIHLDTHAIKFKTDNRKLFNDAGRHMVKKFKEFFPHWNQFDHPYGMLDPADSTRVDDLGNPVWEYIEKIPYGSEKLSCSVYVS